MKAVISAYQYMGDHRHYDPERGRLVDGFEHWCWRYRIVVNELTIYYRQGFCSYASAIKSLQNSWPKVESAIRAESRADEAP